MITIGKVPCGSVVMRTYGQSGNWWVMGHAGTLTYVINPLGKRQMWPDDTESIIVFTPALTLDYVESGRKYRDISSGRTYMANRFNGERVLVDMGDFTILTKDCGTIYLEEV